MSLMRMAECLQVLKIYYIDREKEVQTEYFELSDGCKEHEGSIETLIPRMK